MLHLENFPVEVKSETVLNTSQKAQQLQSVLVSGVLRASLPVTEPCPATKQGIVLL